MKKMYLFNTVLQQVIMIPKSSLKNGQELPLRSIIIRNVIPKNIRFKKWLPKG